MSNSYLSPSENRQGKKPGHQPHQSIDTNASGLSAFADSTISFGGLSLFPNPPASPLPLSPTASDFGFGSRSNFPPSPARGPITPVTPGRGSTHQQLHGSSSAGLSATSHRARGSESHWPQAPGISPHDWHDGASSIDNIDPAEERMLSASFITSILQESDMGSNSTRSRDRRSVASSAMTGASEMTYPPPSRFVPSTPPPVPPLPDSHRRDSAPVSPRSTGTSSPRSNVPLSPGYRPPPIAIGSIPEDASDVNDSDTLASMGDYPPPTVRRASRSLSPGYHGAVVVGVAPATLRSVSSTGSLPNNNNSRRPSVRRNTNSSNLGPVPRESEDDKDMYDEFGVGPADSQHRLYSPALPSTLDITRQNHLRVDTTLRPSATDRHSRDSPPSAVSSWVSPMFNVFRRRAKVLPATPATGQLPILEKDSPNPNHMSYQQGQTTAVEESYFDQAFGDLAQNQKSLRATSPLVFSTFKQKEDASNLPFWKRGRRRFWIIIAAVIIVLAAVIGLAAGLSSKKADPLPKCDSDNVTGVSCNLDATCVCTSTSDGNCNGLAQSLVTLTEDMNNLFKSNYTTGNIYSAFYYAQGKASGCAAQAVLVDVEPALDIGKSPNRTTWAQSAILWNFVRSRSTDGSKEMRNFIARAPWSDLGSTDGPVTSSVSSFKSDISGYTFDFAAQTINPTSSVKFDSDSQASSTQLSRVDSSLLPALDSMCSFALASSTQCSSALSAYWTGVLSQSQDDLNPFISKILSSPIFLPFDSTDDTVTSLWNSSNKSFPPAPACHPGLNSTAHDTIAAFEDALFNVPTVDLSTSFDSSCVTSHPAYGVLNVLQLRLPFIDSRSGLPLQAAVTKRSVNARAMIYSGEELSSFPYGSGTPSSLNPRDLGTFNHINHVLLNYLMSMPNVSVAKDLISFLLSSPTGPPDESSNLASSLASIPLLEVAIFGSILAEDLASVQSSLSTMSGALFFGSQDGDFLREWAITANSLPIIWTEKSISPLIVKETTVSADETFEQIWSASRTAIERNVSSVTVANITQAFSNTDKFTRS